MANNGQLDFAQNFKVSVKTHKGNACKFIQLQI